jgi:competence protein ComGC
MTKETSHSDALEAQVAAAPAKTTVFSDGSTFDYENGYQSNGAPAATRDRTENPTIVKSHTVFTDGLGFQLVGWVLVVLAIASAIIIGISNIQKAENINALKDGVNESGKAKVVQLADGDLIVNDSKGSTFKCDVSMISNDGDPVAHVFCAPGQSAAFSIALPHDPSNVFYTSPTHEIKKSVKNS